MITQRHLFQEAAKNAPTLLETYFWAWLGGYHADIYFQELAITALDGPGHLTDDFRGSECDE